MAATLRLTSTVLFFLLPFMPSSCNTNKNYVKGAVVVGEDDEGLCDLGTFFPPDSATEDNLRTVAIPSVERLLLSRETIPNSRRQPRAVVRGFERSLHGGGAHRHVYSKISLDLDLSDMPNVAAEEDCELVLIQLLSSGLFADAFQLSRLQQQGVVREAHIYGDADLERPAKKSYQSIVQIRQRLKLVMKADLDKLFQSEVNLPLHARYPPISSEKYFVVNITLPHLLISCQGHSAIGTEIGTSVSPSHGLCTYAQWGDGTPEPSAHILRWSIPSGDPAHAPWVEKFTAVAAACGLAAIFLASKLSLMNSGGKI